MCCTRLAGNAGPKKSPSGHIRATLSGYIFATKAIIDNRKNVRQQCLLHMSSQYGELRPTNDWDLFESLGHPGKFQRVSRLSIVTARHSSIGRQPYSAERPSRWALAHISSFGCFCIHLRSKRRQCLQRCSAKITPSGGYVLCCVLLMRSFQTPSLYTLFAAVYEGAISQRVVLLVVSSITARL